MSNFDTALGLVTSLLEKFKLVPFLYLSFIQSMLLFRRNSLPKLKFTLLDPNTFTHYH